MKKRKLLETLKELIETNAQLSAQNEELQALVRKVTNQPICKPAAEQSQSADKNFEKLESDNRILSQELIEAKAKILELTKQLDAATLMSNEEALINISAEQETAEPEIIAPVDNEIETGSIQSDNEIDLFIGLSLNINEEPQTTEPEENNYIVKPIFYEDDTINPDVNTNTPAADTIATQPSADITDWQIDIASQYIGKAIIMITEFNNEIADSTSENKQDLITLALGKSEGFKAEIVDAISACDTPEAAKATAEKRIDELKRYINALRLSL